MTKNNLISAIPFLSAILQDRTLKVLNFGTMRKLTEVAKQATSLKTELEELQKIETDDAEEGVKNFLNEEAEFMPLDVTDFDNFPPTDSGLAYKNEQGETGDAITFSEIAQILFELKVIQ